VGAFAGRGEGQKLGDNVVVRRDGQAQLFAPTGSPTLCGGQSLRAGAGPMGVPMWLATQTATTRLEQDPLAGTVCAHLRAVPRGCQSAQPLRRGGHLQGGNALHLLANSPPKHLGY